jgi:hypothetical protein
MWDKINQAIGSFTDPVLSAHDADGYPASLRTPVVPDAGQQVLNVQIATDLELQPGPASLLFHSHNEQLWDLRNVLVRGELAHTGSSWVFIPRQLAPARDADGGLALLKIVLDLRKVAAAYLKKRGLARPQVPWDRLKAAKGVGK